MPDEQGNLEDLPLRRPTSFSKAYATTKIGATHALSKIESWADSYNDKIEAAAAAGRKEQEDKGFWGKIATWGTTLGCVVATGVPTGGMSLGGCVALGTAVGAGTRYAVDKGNDWEQSIPQAVDGLDTKYYRDKVPEIAKQINDAADNLQDWNDNMWKADIMSQLGDSWSAYKMGSMGIKMAQGGIFGEGMQTKFGDSLTTGIEDEIVDKTMTSADESLLDITDIIKGINKE
jgi:hypothetical protein